MDNDIANNDTTLNAMTAETWQLSALTEALGDLKLTISDSLSLGRGNDNDVVLGSKEVSRNHAVLSVLNGKLYVKDLDSSNGTFVNDTRIEGNKSQHIGTDDKVTFASFAFQVMPAPMTDNEPNAVPVPTDNHPADISIETLHEKAIDAPVHDTDNDSDHLSADEAPSTVAPAADTDTVSQPPQEASVIDATVAPVEEEAVTEDAPSDTAPHTAAPEPTAEPITEPAAQPQPIADPEPQPAEDVRDPHDKTTKTELQEEADPEVLRAKEAATSQFAGTTNLGQQPDLGTAGNNAATQEMSNPAAARTEHGEKKSSGGWFIWVFVAIIIIGLALWLFNMGSM